MYNLGNSFALWTIKELKQDQQNRMGAERYRFNERRINKAMKRTRVDKSNSRERCRIMNIRWNKRDREVERVWIRKSGYIKLTLFWQHTKLNAILSMCKVLKIALYFFEFTMQPKSLESMTGIGIVMAAHPLAAKDEGLMQSLAMCPVAPQNMHSLLSKHCFHSTGSNLTSLPRTDSMIVAGIELEDF